MRSWEWGVFIGGLLASVPLVQADLVAPWDFGIANVVDEMFLSGNRAHQDLSVNKFLLSADDSLIGSVLQDKEIV